MPLPTRSAAVALCALLAACNETRGGNAPSEAESCRIVEASIPLPVTVNEASGAAFSNSYPGMFWTHNDSGNEPDLYAVGMNGVPAARVRLAGARMVDWEDMAVGPCPGGRCVYVGDLGDTRDKADPVTLYAVAEPAPGTSATPRVRAYTARFPSGQPDTEALFVLPGGEVYLISKGSKEAIELFRWPTPLREGADAMLTRVRTLSPEPEQTGDRVTGAGASPNGQFVAVRTYSTLLLYRTADLLGNGAALHRTDLTPLGEPQGEGVSLANDGTVLLVSEGSGAYTPGSASLLRCPL
ncbi:MAG TPA: hypothetical protein VE913_23320 [Longimicrobium sp.]|nr:hypothetical protein [Longimicrobium sp.]